MGPTHRWPGTPCHGPPTARHRTRAHLLQTRTAAGEPPQPARRLGTTHHRTRAHRLETPTAARELPLLQKSRPPAAEICCRRLGTGAVTHPRVLCKRIFSLREQSEMNWSAVMTVYITQFTGKGKMGICQKKRRNSKLVDGS